MPQLRFILALVLLQLACSSQHVEAKSRFKHAHRFRQSWSRPSQNWNWWNWWNYPEPSFDPLPQTPETPLPEPPVPSPLPAPPSNPLPPRAPSLPTASPVNSLPPQSSSLAPAPSATSPAASPTQTPSLAPATSATQPSPSPSPVQLTSISSASSLPATSAVTSPSTSVSPATTSLSVPSSTSISSAFPAPISISSSLAPVPTVCATISSSSLALAPAPTSTISSSSLAPAPTATTLPTTANKTSAGCSNPRVRPEWRSLSRQQQANYISTVKCLAKMPSKLLPGGDYRRYNDFDNVHSRMRTKIHWMALFLPWHRHFMFLYEQTLRNECGYTGNFPRWDWTLDSNDMTKSLVGSADPMVGFGSNGRNFTDVDSALDGGVVTDGAFANWDLYYPEYHQLQRNYNFPSQYKVAGRSWGSQYLQIQSQSTYAKFALALEGTDPASTGPSNPGPHSIIHVIVGGDISPTSYAANEYHWWRWQNAQRSTRLNAYGGPTTRGSTKDTAKITDGLKFLSLSADVQVQDTMDTYSSKYCYIY